MQRMPVAANNLPPLLQRDIVYGTDHLPGITSQSAETDETDHSNNQDNVSAMKVEIIALITKCNTGKSM